MTFTNIKTAIVNFALLNRKLSLLLFIAISFISFYSIKHVQAYNASQPCTRYCVSVQKLPTEQQYFAGIDNYESRFPQRVKRFRELKKLEESNSN